MLNAILGGLGTTVNLTAVGYQGLANTYVTVNQLITASGGLLTTSNVMTASLPGSEWSTIWKDAVANQVAQLNCAPTPTPSPCNASTALDIARQLVDVGVALPAGLHQRVVLRRTAPSPRPPCRPASNVLQMLTTEAEVANGTNAINVQSALGITGVTAPSCTSPSARCPRWPTDRSAPTASTAQVQADLSSPSRGRCSTSR